MTENFSINNTLIDNSYCIGRIRSILHPKISHHFCSLTSHHPLQYGSTSMLADFCCQVSYPSTPSYLIQCR